MPHVLIGKQGEELRPGHTHTMHMFKAQRR